MRLISRLAERRQERILSYARPYLEQDEEVLHWVRARPADGRGEGFVYLTCKKWIVHWIGNIRGAGAAEWHQVRAWGLAGEDSGRTMLGIEAEDRDFYVELPAATNQVAVKVRDFLRAFAELAPSPGDHSLGRFKDFRAFDAGHVFEVMPEQRSLARRTRMILATLFGAALLIVGVALLFLPGPGFLLIIAGLALLATEYDWAKDGLSWAQDKYRLSRQQRRARRSVDPE